MERPLAMHGLRALYFEWDIPSGRGSRQGPPRRAKAVRRLLRENKNIKIIYLPKGLPFPNAMEECWHRGKRVLFVFEYYKTFLEMHQAVSLYYWTARFKLDLLKFASRKPAIYCKNL